MHLGLNFYLNLELGDEVQVIGCRSGVSCSGHDRGLDAQWQFARCEAIVRAELGGCTAAHPGPGHQSPAPCQCPSCKGSPPPPPPRPSFVHIFIVKSALACALKSLFFGTERR